MANPQTSTIQKSHLLNLPLDVLYLIDDHLEEEPSAQLAFRLTCRSIYCSLRPCMLQDLPEDYNPYIRPHLFKFLQLVQDENSTPCGKCYRVHNIKNVLRHPSWRENSPYDYMCQRAAGTFNVCPCINITAADGYFLWSWFWGVYGMGATDPVDGTPLASRITGTNTFLHRCRGPSHPLFSQYDISIIGYANDVSPITYHRKFGNSPTFELTFDIEYRFEIIHPREPLDEDDETTIDTIKLCPHMRLIYWNSFGNLKFDIEQRECRVCGAKVSAIVEDQTTMIVKVKRVYGNCVGGFLPFKRGLEMDSSEGETA